MHVIVRPWFVLIVALAAFALVLVKNSGGSEELSVIQIKFDGIECTKFTIFQSTDVAIDATPDAFVVTNDDPRGIIVSGHGAYQYSFVDVTDNAANKMYYRPMGVGSWAATDQVPTPPEGPWIEFSNLLIGRTEQCEEPKALANEQELYRQLKERLE